MKLQTTHDHGPLKAGESVVTIRFPKAAKSEASPGERIDCLLRGGYKSHGAAQLPTDGEKNVGEVKIVTTKRCDCFGIPLTEGANAVAITISGKQSKEEKLEVAEALLKGKLRDVLLPESKVVKEVSADERCKELEKELRAANSNLEEERKARESLEDQVQRLNDELKAIKAKAKAEK